MKILTVDDEFVSREKMKKILSGFGQCDVVDSGRAAMFAFEKALNEKMPFDLMTIDVSMPEMDGTELLLHIRKKETDYRIHKTKHVKIMMVTSHSDKDTIITSVQAGCDEYIVKPFDRNILINKLEKMGFFVIEKLEEQGTARMLVMETVKSFQKRTIDLPVLSQVVNEIQKIMESPNSDIDEISRAIEKDAVISVRLIATANSPAYRGADKINCVREAIPRLGLKESQSIISAIASKSLYETKNMQCKKLMEKIWVHSLACAYCAKSIAIKIGFGDHEKLFTLGLLHDIGKVLLLKPLGSGEYQNVSFDKTDLLDSIQEVHASFGAALLEHWGFTNMDMEVVSLHEWSKYNLETRKDILIINLANQLARKIGFTIFENDVIDLNSVQSLKLLNIPIDTVNAIGEEVKKIIQDTANVF